MNPAIYGRIDVPNKAELREKTRDLDENQRKVIDIFGKKFYFWFF